MKDATDNEIAENIFRRFEQAERIWNDHVQMHSTLRDYSRPSNESVGNVQAPLNTSRTARKFTRLFDTTLVRALLRHSGGIKSWMSPAQSPWYEFAPPREFRKDDEIISWYRECTDILNDILQQTEYHSEDHEAIIEGAAFGPRCIFTDISARDGVLMTQQWETGSYYVLENERGRIDTVFRTKRFTARQAKKMFGLASLPEKVRTQAETATTDGQDSEYIHAIYPREDAEIDGQFANLPENMPVASVWIHKETKKIVRSSGFEEMAVSVSRYLKWGDSPYGMGAALIALADARQLNRLQERLDLKVDKQVNPSILLPSELEEMDVNLAPGGITYYEDPQRIPRVLQMDNGSTNEEMLRVRYREECINKALFLEIFEAVSRKTKEMTATESQLVSQEAIDLFSPMFLRMTSEHYGPDLSRKFNLLLRQSEVARAIGDMSKAVFPPVPKKLIRIVGKTAEIPAPQLNYTSRIALALKAIHARALERSLARRAAAAQFIGAEAYDDLNIPVALKSVDRGDGLPEDFFHTSDTVAAIKSAREQQQQLAAAAAMAKDASTAVKNVKGTPVEQAVMA